jgi:mono/diheme cytochrome c family protein
MAMALGAAAEAGAQDLPGDAVAGRAFAQTNCSACHVVSRMPLWPPPGRAPAFADIARNHETTEIGLRAFLQTPHARMPNLILAPRDTDDVISYILSLRQP